MTNAIAIALGTEPIADDAAPIRVVGARNDYNSRGRGSTMARRVLRRGSWEWVSAPTSRGRFLSADRNDKQYGDVWIGEVLAQYTLGGRGRPAPEKFYLVEEPDENGKHLQELTHVRRRDGRYTLTLPDDQLLLVSDPAWR